MFVYHLLVMLDLRAVVVPVAQLEVFGHELCHSFGLVFGVLVNSAYAAVSRVYEHIAPYFALKTVFVGYGEHPL